MQTIIYRISDLQCVGVVMDSMTINEALTLNVIPNFGGTNNNYSSIQTDKINFHLELINGVVTVVEDSIPTQPKPPTLEDRIASLEDAMNFQLGLGV